MIIQKTATINQGDVSVLPKTPTAHNEAPADAFAETVLLAGDPLRAKLIAEKFLKDTKLVNNIRNVCGYTGIYKGVPVSVMGSGMGMPSMGIYSYELYTAYNVKRIIRVGSCGSMTEEAPVGSLVIAQAACYEPGFIEQYSLPATFCPIATYNLLANAVVVANRQKLEYTVGNVLTTNTFYKDSNDSIKMRKMGVLAVEMETAALYSVAARLGKEALSILTVSDSIVTGEAMPAQDRQSKLTDMIRLTLELVVDLTKD